MNKSNKKHLDYEQLITMYSLISRGCGYKEVCAKLNCSRQTLYRIITQHCTIKKETTLPILRDTETVCILKDAERMALLAARLNAKNTNSIVALKLLASLICVTFVQI